MKTPNMAETLRDEAKRSERLRIILMALDCENLEELIKKLKAEEQKENSLRLYLTQTADYTTEACPEPYIRSSFIYYTTYF